MKGILHDCRQILIQKNFPAVGNLNLLNIRMPIHKAHKIGKPEIPDANRINIITHITAFALQLTERTTLQTDFGRQINGIRIFFVQIARSA